MSRTGMFLGFLAGNLIYRGISTGGLTGRIVLDSVAVALITIGLMALYTKLKKR